MWQREAETFAEVAVPDDAGVAVAGFGIHPVVLDAALHAMGVVGEHDSMVLPFSWQGVCLHAAGASRVRVRIAPAGGGAVSVELADGAGLPVLSVRHSGERVRLPLMSAAWVAPEISAQASIRLRFITIQTGCCVPALPD